MGIYVHSAYQIRNNIMLSNVVLGLVPHHQPTIRHNSFCLYCLYYLQSNHEDKTHHEHIDETLNMANLLNLLPNHVSLVGWGEERTPTFK